MKSSDTALHIATIGKCVGLRGDLKLHLHTDFPEQFKPGATFQTENGATLTIHSYRPDKSLVQFVGYQDRENAAKLTNQKLMTSVERSRQECNLKEGEYFWFEMTGATVVEKGEALGVVDEIERIVNTDYLIVKTDADLVSEGASTRFYIPYIPKFILSFDKAAQRINVTGAKDILAAS